jgi:hypothetical protein
VALRSEITSPGLVRVSVRGVIDPHAVVAFLRSLAADPAFRPQLPRLVDMREAPQPLPVGDLERVAYAFEQMRSQFSGSRAAIVVATTAMFGVVRQYGTLVERAGIEVSPFMGEREALAWLGVETTPNA